MPLFFQVFDTIGAAAAAAVLVALVIMVYATIINTGLITQVLALQLLFRCEKRLVHKATRQAPPPKMMHGSVRGWFTHLVAPPRKFVGK